MIRQKSTPIAYLRLKLHKDYLNNLLATLDREGSKGGRIGFFLNGFFIKSITTIPNRTISKIGATKIKASGVMNKRYPTTMRTPITMQIRKIQVSIWMNVIA